MGCEVAKSRFRSLRLFWPAGIPRNEIKTAKALETRLEST